MVAGPGWTKLEGLPLVCILDAKNSWKTWMLGIMFLVKGFGDSFWERGCPWGHSAERKEVLWGLMETVGQFGGHGESRIKLRCHL